MKRKKQNPASDDISNLQRIGNIGDATMLDACLKIITAENQYVLNLKLEKSHVHDILRSLLKKSFHPSHCPTEIKNNPELSGTEVPPALWVNDDTCLTAREFEIMQLVSQGLYNKEIADRLGLKRATVRTFLNKVNIKFRVNNRMEASNKFRELLNAKQ